MILGVGELLWDLLPDGERLGGAPANFSVMAGRLGNRAVILSRIGQDELGSRAADLLAGLPVEAGFLQVDPAHETGRVSVELSHGQPSYTIHDPAAWDFMEATDEWVELAESADAICFGSLAQRNPWSRETIQKLVERSPRRCMRVFDVNLRLPFYSAESIRQSLELATVMKLNDAEMPLVLGLLGLAIGAAKAGEELRRGAEQLLAEFPGLWMVALTMGGAGSILVTREEWHQHPGIKVKVADTIGAGDAFTAALTHYLLRGADLATLNEAGNRWGSWVASQSGAMPRLPDAVKTAIAAAIER